MTRSDPPLNVDYWALRYTGQQDPESTYQDALREYTDPLDRAEALWHWKDLSRGVDIDAVTDAVSTAELRQLAEQPPGEAVAALGDQLVDQGALANQTVVTPAFLLHLTDTAPDAYSVRFPIFDVRCWVAYAYLTGFRTGDQPLPQSATTSASRFGDFSEFFQQTIPDRTDGRQYEQALFRFGSYIASLPFETVAGIDDHLAALEDAVSTTQATHGYALVRRTERGDAQ